MRKALYAISLLVAAAITYSFGVFGRPIAFTHSAEEVRAVYDAELAIARAQGLVVSEEGVTSQFPFGRGPTVAAGECVALVAVMEGTVSVHASLRIGATGPVADSDVVHLAACASEAGSAFVEVTPTTVAPFEHPQVLHFAILTGHVASPRTYARLWYDAEQRARFDAEAVRARAATLVPLDARLAAARTADPEHAVLLPPTRASFAALRRLAGRPDVASGVIDPRVPDPFASAADVHQPPRVLTDAGQARALAVVDAGALDTPCVSVSLARLDDPLAPTVVRRVSLPDLTVSTLPATDPAITVDRICPAAGLFVYVVDESAGGDYDVIVSRVEAELDAAPVPSDFGAAPQGHHVVAPPEPLPFVVSTRARCTSGDPRACLTLAVLARDGIVGAGTVREALEPLCTASGGPSCDVLAGALASSEPSEAERFERDACTTGVPEACLRRGARFLADARDLDVAYQTFAYGCDHACTSCCTAATTMIEWELSAHGDVDHPTDPG